MEQIANLHIEKLPEGVYLAASEDIPGLAAQDAPSPRRWRLLVMLPKSCWKHKLNGIDRRSWYPLRIHSIIH